MKMAGKIGSDVLIDQQASAVLKTLLYYDIFQYPLTLDEIFNNHLIYSTDKKSLFQILEKLVSEQLIFKSDKFYRIRQDDSINNRREKGNVLAKQYLQKAYTMSAFISKFPFIRCVSLSGSISKGYMDENADIDYFIITAPGRLWLSRTLLALYKKVFRFNSRKYLCINYFIDDMALEIAEKNIYTATEIVTLIPTYNNILFKRFREKNGWTNNFRPNYNGITHLKPDEIKEPKLKLRLEKFLKGKTGDALDLFCYRLTILFWKYKFRKLDRQEFNHCFRSSRHISKHHPQNFQKKVLNLYEQKIKEFELHHDIKLS